MENMDIYDRDGNLMVFCRDNKLYNDKKLYFKIRNLIENHPKFSSYTKDLSFPYSNFYILTHKGKNYLGYYNGYKEDTDFLRKCKNITLEQLLYILCDKDIKPPKIRNISFSFIIKKEEIKIDNFDPKRYF